MRIIDCLKAEDEQSTVRKAISLSIAGILNSILNVVLQMLIARYYTKSEIAIYSQTQLICTTATTILQIGIPSGIYYFLVRSKNRTRAIFREGLLCVSFTGGLFSAFLLCGGNYLFSSSFSNDDLSITLIIAIPYIMLTLFESVALTLLVYKNRIRFNAYYNIIKSCIIVGCLILSSILFDKGVILFLVRAVIASIFGLFTLYIVSHYIVPKDNSTVDKEGIRQLLMVSVPLGFASIAGTLSANLDNWIVSGLLDPETFSIYHMGAYEIPFIGVITGSLMTVVTVELNKAVNNNDYKRAVSIFSGIAEKSSLLLIPIMVFLFFSANNFICFLFTDEFIEAIPIFQCYLLYIPIRLVTYGPFMVALGKSKLLLKREIVTLILNAIMSIFMVKILGGIGASISTIFVTYAYSVPVNIHIISKECNVKWYRVLPFAHIGKCFVLSFPSAIVSTIIGHLFLNKLSYLMRLIIMFLCFSSSTGFIYIKAFRLPYKDMWNRIKKYLKLR